MRLFQLLSIYKRHEENKSKIGQERRSIQQADYQCHQPTPSMQESVSKHKIQKSGIRAWIKQGRRKRKKRDMKDKG